MTLYEELKWRGLIKDEAGENLEEKINKGGRYLMVRIGP